MRIKFWTACMNLLCLIAGVADSNAHPAQNFRSARTGCALTTNLTRNPYEIATFIVLPGDRVELRIEGTHAEPHRLEISAGVLEGDGRRWSWTAPRQPGIYEGEFFHPDSGTVTQLIIVVLIPMSRAVNGSLNGYRIGTYPPPMNGREEFYRTPRGFIEVTEENQHTRLSPHFTLGQFISKQEAPFPKYVILRANLLVALERILEEVNRSGFEAESLFIMSGYRTPFYNRAIGNVANSRHIFGDASDIFVDQDPKDDVMDDLDGNGVIDEDDNVVLSGIIDRALQRTGTGFVGGMGEYPANTAHGPFVHFDLRGYRARW